MAAKQFLQIVGVVLIIAGVLGFMIPGIGSFLTFHTHHNILHLISGLALLYLRFKGTESVQRLGCQVFGIVYGAITIWGFLGHQSFLYLTLHLNTAYNIIHLAVSVLGLCAGFGKRSVAAAA
ncbi:MAG: DUF4383 domain-containing protein [bacterium]